MSQSATPTLSKVFPIFNLLLDSVEKFIEVEDKSNIITLYNAGLGALEKLKGFYSKTDECDLYPIATSNSNLNALVLNPCYKMKLFLKLEFSKKDCKRYEALFTELFLVTSSLTLEICH